MITICFQIRRNTSVDRNFRPRMRSSVRLKSGRRNSRNFSNLHASKNYDIAINCALRKAVIMSKNKCMLIHLSFLLYLNRLRSKRFNRLSYYACRRQKVRPIFIHCSYPAIVIYCHTLSSVVGSSVCLSVDHVREPCKNC